MMKLPAEFSHIGNTQGSDWNACNLDLLTAHPGKSLIGKITIRQLTQYVSGTGSSEYQHTKIVSDIPDGDVAAARSDWEKEEG